MAEPVPIEGSLANPQAAVCIYIMITAEISTKAPFMQGCDTMGNRIITGANFSPCIEAA